MNSFHTNVLSGSETWKLNVEKKRSKLSDICENAHGGLLHHVHECKQLKANMFYTFF
jgi:glutamine synthetase